MPLDKECNVSYPYVKKALHPFSNLTRNVEVRHDLPCNNNGCPQGSDCPECATCIFHKYYLIYQDMVPLQEGCHSLMYSGGLTSK